MKVAWLKDKRWSFGTKTLSNVFKNWLATLSSRIIWIMHPIIYMQMMTVPISLGMKWQLAVGGGTLKYVKNDCQFN